MSETPPHLLIYDGECPICQRARDWVMARARTGTVEPLACQDDQRAARAPQVDAEACMEAMHLVAPDGTTYVGEEAFPPLFRLLPGYNWLGRVMQWPGLRHLSPVVYRWIARHRLSLGAWLPTEKGGTHCTIDGECR